MANWMRFLDDHFDDEVQNRAVGGNMSAVVFFLILRIIQFICGDHPTILKN